MASPSRAVSGSDAGNDVEAARLPESSAPRGLVVDITPTGAFAGALVVVSALALALAVGRRYPLAPVPAAVPEVVETQTLQSVQLQPPIRYDELLIDRGDANSPGADGKQDDSP